jgi:hypothetical protein
MSFNKMSKPEKSYSLLFRDDRDHTHYPKLVSIIMNYKKKTGVAISASEAIRLCIRNEYTRINVKK